jgi:Ni/Co efflux regulator RcnB
MGHNEPQHGGPEHGGPGGQGGPGRPGEPGPQHYAGGPPHNGGWRQGDHYTGNRVVVNDWQHHGLHRPPQGYEWVNYGGQYMMIALTTGIIASVIASSGSPY